MPKVKGKRRWCSDVNYTWEHLNRQHKVQPYMNQQLRKAKGQDNQQSQVKKKQKQSNWYCQACKVMLISKDHARVHYYSRRHQKILNQQSLRIVKVSNVKSEDVKSGNVKCENVKCEGQDEDQKFDFKIKSELELEIPSFDRGNFLEPEEEEFPIGIPQNTFSPGDFTTYITPTGKYYCHLCNRMGQNKFQFEQHLNSRKHRIKVGNAIRKADKLIGSHFTIPITKLLPKHSSIDDGCNDNNPSSSIKKENVGDDGCNVNNINSFIKKEKVSDDECNDNNISTFIKKEKVSDDESP